MVFFFFLTETVFYFQFKKNKLLNTSNLGVFFLCSLKTFKKKKILKTQLEFFVLV